MGGGAAAAQAQPAPASVPQGPAHAANQADCPAYFWRMDGDGVRIHRRPALHSTVVGMAYRGDVIGADDTAGPHGEWTHIYDVSRTDPATGRSMSGWVASEYVGRTCVG